MQTTGLHMWHWSRLLVRYSHLCTYINTLFHFFKYMPLVCETCQNPFYAYKSDCLGCPISAHLFVFVIEFQLAKQIKNNNNINGLSLEKGKF